MAALAAEQDNSEVDASNSEASEGEEASAGQDRSFCSFSSETEVSRGTAQIEGWLSKQGTFNTAWKRRWFAIRHGRLEYYVSDRKMDFKGSFLLDSCKLVPADTPAHAFVVSQNVDGKKRNVLLKAESDEDRSRWMENCRDHGTEPLMTGWMSKLGHRIKSIKRRFFVLDPSGKLHYFKSPDGNWKGTINLVDAHVITSHDAPEQITIDARFVRSNGVMEDVQFVLYAESRKDRNAWVKAMRSVGLEDPIDGEGGDLDGYVSMNQPPDDPYAVPF